MVRMSTRISMLLAVQFAFFFLTVLYTQLGQNVLFVVLYIFASCLFFFIQNETSFSIFIIGILVSMFFLLFQAFSKGWNTVVQAQQIGLHFLVIANFFLIYITTYSFKVVLQENKSLHQKTMELENYVAGLNILTMNEFKKRTKLIQVAQTRRGEQGMLIYINLSAIGKYVQSSVFDTVGTTALETIRTDFDLVGKLNTFSLIILLQNTNENGAQIVINRLLAKLKENLEKNAVQHIEITMKQLTDEAVFQL
ncbi:hypothetical protein ACFDTO_30355 [Microbacteriaceae bacterium 4G12]